MTRIFFLVAALLCSSTFAYAGGGPNDPPAEGRDSPYSGIIPPCDDSGVLGTISSRFAGNESDYWNSTIEIGTYKDIREISLRGNGLSYIPRRYCAARAVMNDNSEHTIIYQVQESLGFVGWGYGVEWCVVGYDREHAYSPACSSLRPFLVRNLGEPALRESY
jgi:hypothetical protein